MKAYLYLVLLIWGSMAFFSCKGSAGKQEANQEENKPLAPGFTRGEILTSFAEQGCPVLVRVEMEGKSQLRRPISLPENFAKEGMVIQFKYRMSRARQMDCEEGMPIIVSEVSELK